MVRNVLEYLEMTVTKFPNKIAFDDDKKQITYAELFEQAKSIGSTLLDLGIERKPVVVYLPKSCDCITAFMGIVYSGGFYCPIDVTMPIERISIIVDVLKPAAVITNVKLFDKAQSFCGECKVILFDEAIASGINEKAINGIRRTAIDSDPLYVLFTSGSTGVPKGVLISHKSVVDYTEWVSTTFDINDFSVFGNQAPFYFDNSILDIYSSIKNGGKVVIIPKKKFMFPIDLVRYLNEKEINIIFWVPSMMCMMANLKAFDVEIPRYLTKVLFCGEIMPNKQLNIWRKAIPNALYANLYGPTEITDVCTYYIVDREFADDEPLPIGIPCQNTRILVLNEKNQIVQKDESGELCVAGTCLALGYYNNPNKTKEVFVQNPLNTAYEEKIYRTGDLVKYNEYGELMYLSRKDFQIKHLGHRIELGEIETATGDISEVENCACIYIDEEQEIVMCYTGMEMTAQDISSHLKSKIPTYMIPGRYVYCKKMPYNINGKIDRLELKKDIMKKESNLEAE